MECSENCFKGEERSAWKNNLLTVHYYVLLTQYFSGDKIEKSEMGGACSAYRERRGVYRVLVGKQDYLEDPEVDVRIILR
jgi:hypothetical protein